MEWLKQQKFVSHSFGGWKFKIKGSADMVTDENSLPGLQTASFSLCPHRMRRKGSWLYLVLRRYQVSGIRASLLWPPLTLTISLKGPTFNTVTWGWYFNRGILGRTQFRPQHRLWEVWNLLTYVSWNRPFHGHIEVKSYSVLTFAFVGEETLIRKRIPSFLILPMHFKLKTGNTK